MCSSAGSCGRRNDRSAAGASDSPSQRRAIGGYVVVEYEFLGELDQCSPDVIRLTVNSVENLGKAWSGSIDGGPLAVRGRAGRVSIRVPTGETGRLEARASAI